MTITDRLGRTLDEGDSSASDYAHAGLAIKAAVVCATTANITLAGLQTIDGITVVADDRVLVKDQTTASGNGIYVASSGVWERSRDMDGAGEIARGTQVFVVGGTVNALTNWYVSSANPITIGTTSITWTVYGLNSSIAALENVNLQTGTTQVDFGAFPGASDTSVAVTGQTAIVAGSIIEAWITAKATTDHSADEHIVDPPMVTAGNISAGVGFTIYAVARNTASYGKYQVNWRWV